MELPTTTREFWKHTVYGDIYAVELLAAEGQREVLSARKCSRPEEQTRGALPVMELYSGEDAALVSTHRTDFSLWEPPMTSDDKIEGLRVKVTATRVAKSDYERIRKQERASLKHYDKCVSEEHAAAEALVDPPADAPLIAIAESRPVDAPAPGAPTTTDAAPPDDPHTPGAMSPEEFDAAFGGADFGHDMGEPSHDDTGDDAQPEPPPQ